MTTRGSDASGRVDALPRAPRVAAAISGAIAPVALAIDFLVLDEPSWPLLGMVIVAALICVLALWNVASVRGGFLVLLSSRTKASGTERRWSEQRALIDHLATWIADADVWDVVRAQRNRRPATGALLADVPRAIAIVFGVAGIAVVVLSARVIGASGVLG